MKRREFIKAMAAGAAVASLPSPLAQQAKALPVSRRQLSSWKGFNLLNMFNPYNVKPFSELDFEIMAEWGFNFARIPMSYWSWSSPNDWNVIDEQRLRLVDRVVELGRQYKIHVDLCFHRIPGYCISVPKERANLFEDDEALRAACRHWRVFAERYASEGPKYLSFNLLNEAPYIEAASYERVARALIAEIRRVSPKRTIIVDGLNVGTKPLMSIADVDNIIQSGRGYQPMLVSHYAASWVYGDKPMYFPKQQLAWPLRDGDKYYDKAWLARQLEEPWRPWSAAGGLVHIGEFGAHNQTPHNVVLAWMKDQFDIFKRNHWGWSLWNLYGSFGVLDSQRADVAYEDYKGHKLDRRMLELLRRYR